MAKHSTSNSKWMDLFPSLLQTPRFSFWFEKIPYTMNCINYIKAKVTIYTKQIIRSGENCDKFLLYSFHLNLKRCTANFVIKWTILVSFINSYSDTQKLVSPSLNIYI